MRFGEALDDVFKYGHDMRRACWDDENCYVGFKLPDASSDMTTGYFYLQVEDITAPYVPNIFDMTAHDWELIKR